VYDLLSVFLKFLRKRRRDIDDESSSKVRSHFGSVNPFCLCIFFAVQNQAGQDAGTIGGARCWDASGASHLCRHRDRTISYRPRIGCQRCVCSPRLYAHPLRRQPAINLPSHRGRLVHKNGAPIFHVPESHTKPGLAHDTWGTWVIPRRSWALSPRVRCRVDDGNIQSLNPTRHPRFSIHGGIQYSAR
jgi:hypothetical protein